MFNNLMYKIMGIAISANGIYLLFEREFASRRFGHIDFGPYHYVYGAILLAVGIVIVTTAWKKIETDNQ